MTSDPKGIDRRALLQMTALGAAGLAAGPVLAACGSGGKSPSSASTLRPLKSITEITLPFLADMGTPDPDIFYASEGLQVTMSCYEGLLSYTPVAAGAKLAYQPPSKRISPGLAKSWNISPDGLTYTFNLRSGVTFHDGTPMNSAAWQKSFMRRGAVNGGPSYQVAPIASIKTPDPLTLIVILKQPCTAFLDYLACPFGTRALSPSAVALHEVKGDLAQAWLSTHEAGTGPYRITEWVVNEHYTLEADPNYWGPQPMVKKVNIPIIPNVATQEVMFNSGQIDIITKGLPIQDVLKYAKDPSFTVNHYELSFSVGMFFNDSAPGRIFHNPAARLAAKHAINKTVLTDAVFKGFATPSTQFFPDGCFPAGLVPDNPRYDPSILMSLAPRLPSKKVDLGYGVDNIGDNRPFAELVQTELSAAGLDVTIRGIPVDQEFNYYKTPDHQRPDIMLDGFGGDTIHVDTLLRIQFRSSAVVNFFDYSYPAADRLMDVGLDAATDAASIQAYAEAGNIYSKANVLENFCNNVDLIVARAGITNFMHDPQTLQTVRLKDLKLA